MDANETNADGEMGILKQIQFFSRICTVLMILICLFGLIGNALSLAIYTRPKFRKKSINVLLCALSASDLCVCFIAIPVFSIFHLKDIVEGSERATALVMVYLYPVVVMFQSMSVWLLVAITVDRYLAVCHPFYCRSYCTKGRAMIIVGITVFFSIAYNLVRFWEFQFVDHPSGQLEEMVQPQLRENPAFMLFYQNILTLISQFVLPVVVLLVLNIQVARTIIEASHQREGLVASQRREHSTAKMMIFVVIVFLVCYTFSIVLNVLEIIDSSLFRQSFGYLLNDVNNILVVVNSSTTFIFYVKYSTRYRKQLRTLYGIRWIAAKIRFREMKKKNSNRNGSSTNCRLKAEGSYLRSDGNKSSYSGVSTYSHVN